VKETERIADQLKRSFAGEAWHGPAVKQVLEGVSAAQAVARPIPGAHNIWELTLHIGAWENAGLRRLNGDRAELADDEDWSAVTGTSEEAWNQLKANLEEGNHKLVQAIERLDEMHLDEPILEGMPSVYITLHGVIQHNLYHAGQIAILKKALAGRLS
jgi:uncharacterized damage-inducible protein DinB